MREIRQELKSFDAKIMLFPQVGGILTNVSKRKGNVQLKFFLRELM